jgi:hypothetical protein
MKHIGEGFLLGRPLEFLTQAYTAPSGLQKACWPATIIGKRSESALPDKKKQNELLPRAPERQIWILDMLHAGDVFQKVVHKGTGRASRVV